MPEQEIGWIAAIVVGGLAGWFAEMFMKSGIGILMNIVLGIVGAALANWLLGLFGVALGGWIGYLIAGFIGACIIIFLWRVIRGGEPNIFNGWRSVTRQRSLGETITTSRTITQPSFSRLRAAE
jgi:uncharacterized membrane protein YeaQ/YmgE (transglycosylase-associated protein family)